MGVVRIAATVPFVGLFLIVAVACGPEEARVDTDRAGLRPATRIVEDGTVVRTSTGTCQLAACASCPQPSYADIVRAGSSTVAVVCYPVNVDRVFTPVSGRSLNVNAGSSSIAVDLSRLPNHTFVGDININRVTDASIFGSTSTPTVVRGNINLHAGDVRLFNLIVEGDVSFNNNRTGSALIDTIVRGNLNVHVHNFVGVRDDVFGDFNINRARSTIANVGFGQNANIHGTPLFCRNLNPFTDSNASGFVDPAERSAQDACPALGTSFDFDVAFDRTGVDVVITGGSGNYDFGMAETGSVFPGWLGEDCLGGVPGYDLCHTNVGDRFRLMSVTSSTTVVPGVSTLFDYLNAGGVTFVVVDGAQCYTKGNDPSYYPGCTRL